jgi:hypothetical protein
LASPWPLSSFINLTFQTQALQEARPSSPGIKGLRMGVWVGEGKRHSTLQDGTHLPTVVNEWKKKMC